MLADAELVCVTMTKLLDFDVHFAETLCSCGLMDGVLVPLLHRIVKDGPTLKAAADKANAAEGHSTWTAAERVLRSLCPMVCRTLARLMRRSPSNLARYRTLGVQRYLVSVVRLLDPQATQSALVVLEEVATVTSDNADLRYRPARLDARVGCDSSTTWP